MEMLKEINKKLEENKTEMISSLSQLITIPSVVSEAKGDMPFGEEVHKSYVYMMDKAKEDGFETFNAQNYGGHIDFKGKEEGILGVLVHLDVVPEGGGWDFEPYGGEVIDGKICGRGALDDKGPTMASYYAMKALKDCGFEPKKTIRLILGLDEETNWYGMNHYLSQVDDVPDMGFTPDADFPAIHGEKGILVFDIVKKFGANNAKGLELSSFKGGTAANSVADHARAVLYDSAGNGYENIKELVAQLRKEKGYKINCKGIGQSFEVTVQGISAHGAKPEQGQNAISIMMEFLGNLNFASEDVAEFISFYNSCIGFELDGKGMGCGLEDEPSGKLVFNTGMIDLDKNTVTLTINIRYPVTLNDEIVYDSMKDVLNKYNFGIVKGKHQPPIYIEESAPLVKTLMDIYRKHTGDEESKPLVIGGGTYARAIENAIAFGAKMPEDPDVAHKKNEYISEENLMKLAKIYAEAIYRLSELE